MDKQSYLIRPRDRTLNFCPRLFLSLSFLLSPLVPRASTYERIPSPFSVRFSSRLESRASRFFEIDSSTFLLFFFCTCLEQDPVMTVITMPTDKYWLKGTIGSKQVFQVMVIKKREGKLFTFSSMPWRSSK